MERKEISPAQRLQNFRSATRQGRRMYESQTTTTAGQQLRFRIPKSKLVSKIYVLVEAVLTATHASVATYTPHEDGAARLVDTLSVDINSGFKPFKISGRNLRNYNRMRSINGVDLFTDATSGENAFVQGLVASSGGTANTVRAMYEVPFTLNASNSIGLLPAQNDTTNIELTLQTGVVGDLAPASSGYTFSLGNVTATVYVEDYTIPNNLDAIPPFDWLKVVHEQVYAKTGAGSETTFKLETGKLIRSIMFVNRNSSAVRVGNSDITSQIQLLLQGTEYPYSYEPELLKYENARTFGKVFPTGIYAFDFGTQDIPAQADFRDFIDSAALTELWLRFTSATAGNVDIVTESLIRLQ